MPADHASCHPTVAAVITDAGPQTCAIALRQPLLARLLSAAHVHTIASSCRRFCRSWPDTQPDAAGLLPSAHDPPRSGVAAGSRRISATGETPPWQPELEDVSDEMDALGAGA